ncbi:MAG: serine/threonine-protein kinase [Actinomycetes bacterium]
MIAERYRLDSLRAHGGMADVWQATDLQLTRVVAIKLLKPHLAAESTLAERFRREAIAAANLNHYNIVTVYDAIEDNGRQAVIMEFVDGESLRERLDREKTLTINSVLSIGYSVCSALEAAHKQGLIHRDVKPGNILINIEKRVMLTDFGIAKALDADEDLTSENIMMGTAKYLSPEQVRGDNLDARADLYSLGLVMYECLAGKVPFVGKNDTDTALARLHRDATDIAKHRPDVDPDVARIINRLIAREPKDRFADAAQAGVAIRRVIEGRKSSTPAGTKRPAGDRTPTPGKVIRPKGHTPIGITRGPVDSSSSQQARQQQSPRLPATTKTSSAKTRSKAAFKPTPAMLIGVIAILLVVGVVFATFNKSNSTSAEPATTTVAATAPVVSGPLQITGIKSFDPQGDDQTENDNEASNVTDGDPTTSWSTTCYKSSTFGSKSGVGLVLQLNGSALAQLQADIQGDGWKARVYTSNSAGSDLESWGSPIWEGSSDDGSTITTSFTTPSQFALVYLTQIGQSGFCSNNNPYRGYISEIRIQPTP